MTQMTIILLTLLSMTVGIEQARPGSTTYNEKTGQSSRPNNEKKGGAATPDANSQVVYDLKRVEGAT